MTQLTLRLINEHFAIHSLSKSAIIPSEVFSASIFFIAKTFDEISIVLPQNITIDSDEVELNWQALEVVGPLALTMTGILSKISTVLANEKISIFAISTFDTDYILVKEEFINQAIAALRANQYIII
ncbi:amino acid-binding protein [Colwellia sp. MT41]|uniref:Amino acid-binding protein n=1 Tax=Colwellia marinimaniae TaxID=1513592 RepID=A0ABQ0MYA7_9GAMM|nr:MULTISPECIES: ACT domain-containing protein [Colwellia]ALO34466.1 amino acid-binding protein [Colwellia sp. MT41]GAW97365.1 amino acid-binding protein [Colwellia marinimaniae]